MDAEKGIVLFESADGEVTLPVKIDLEGEEIWLNRNQLAALYGRDVKTIGKHVAIALREELAGSEGRVVAKYATTASDGKTYQLEHYNLDVIISVGYRVKSRRGVEFRRWATDVLRRYVVAGHVENERRLEKLGRVAKVMARTPGDLGTRQVLDIVQSYTAALDLLDDYDHMHVTAPEGAPSATSSRASSCDLYPTLEEKAANLLYFVVKDHSFLDGNKRIATTIFLYFLDRNGALFTPAGEKVIGDSTLVAVTLLIAESNPEEKDVMVDLVRHYIQRP